MKYLRYLLSNLKLAYLPIFTIYFANSFIIFSDIAQLFWIKNSLSLTPSEIVSITIWSGLPWSMKIIFGQIVDNVKIFNSHRNIYVFIANIFILIGNIVIIMIANDNINVPYLSIFQLLCLSGALVSAGVVLQDLIADTLCYDVVKKTNKDGSPINHHLVQKEINLVQLYSKIFDTAGSFFGVLVGGLIAAKFSYGTISYYLPFVSLIALSGIIIVKKEPKIPTFTQDYSMVLLSSLYFLAVVVFAFIKNAYSQEILFFIGIMVSVIGLKKLIKEIAPQDRRKILSIIVVTFCYRCSPTFGPGVEWWQIDVLNFTPQFISFLKLLTIVISFILLLTLGNKIFKINIAKTFLILNLAHCIFQLPMIGMAYGLHNFTEKYFGIGIFTLSLIGFADTGIDAPTSKLAFLVLCAAATYYAPKKHLANWFAIVMTLMSLAYVGGARILRRILSEIYVIERGEYSNVGELMITTNLINFLIPTLAILIFMNPFNKKNRIKLT
jgi:hypothetical protein